MKNPRGCVIACGSHHIKGMKTAGSPGYFVYKCVTDVYLEHLVESIIPFQGIIGFDGAIDLHKTQGGDDEGDGFWIKTCQHSVGAGALGLVERQSESSLRTAVVLPKWIELIDLVP